MIRKTLVLLALLVALEASAARLVTEVIPIGYRSVDEMVEILRPLVPAPGTISGAYGKLVVRTTPENMQEIKNVLATLDRAPANLLISVRHSIDEEVRRDLAEVFGEVRSGDVTISTGRKGRDRRGLSVGVDDGESEAGVRVLGTRRSADDRDVQQVRVLEGRDAFIRAGEAVPVTDRSVVVSGSGVTTVRESVRFEDVTKGFYVRARLNAGDRVTVEVAPRRAQLGGRGGGIEVSEASTVVSGRLGRWMQIGGVSESSSRTQRGLTSRSSTSSSSDSAIYLKVERLGR